MANDLVVNAENEPGALIALALEKQADPEVIKKMMDLQERWEANTAKKAFVRAMTAYKQEAPAVLKKLGKVDFTSQKGRTCYSYANLGQIVQEVTALLGKHGLSATWQTAQEGNNITVTCHITHEAGHRESVTLTAPADESGNKNRIQAIGSAVTYLQRYTLMAALGIATTDADDDGRGVGHTEKTPIAAPQAKKTEATSLAQPSGDLVIEAVIEKTSSKARKTNNKPWTLYGILAGGNWYNTFDTKLFDIAVACTDKKTTITYWVDAKGKNNLIAIQKEGCTGSPHTCDISSWEGGKAICETGDVCMFQADRDPGAEG